MGFTSILKPDGSVTIGLATAVMIYSVYGQAVPDSATIHATDAGDINIEAGRRKATYTSAALLSAITLLTKDVNVFVLGAITLGILDFHTRHANASNPVTAELVSQGTGYGNQLRSVS